MRYYLGTVFGKSFYNDALIRTGGTGNVLLSYAGQMKVEKALETIKFFDSSKMIIDSGAFSVWNSGKTMDRNKLLAYYKRLKQYRLDFDFINLDVIPGDRGRKPTRTEVDQACKEGLENYYWFREQGIETVPVFHEDDNWEYLEIFKKETNFIAISPANDSSVKKRIRWLDKVYGNLKADYKTHGLAATSKTLLERYPFYSVDSVNWMTPGMYGTSKALDYPIGKLIKENRYMVLKEEIKFYQDLQKYITKLWKMRGVVWSD